MKVLFVIDRVELKYFEFNNLVTNFWLIKNLLEKGCDVRIATIDMLKLRSAIAYTSCFKSILSDNNIFYDKNNAEEIPVNDFDIVLFRPDPPVDLDYISATYIFDFVDKNKTVVLNDTTSIRNFNEKLHTVLFANLMPENIVTSNYSDIINFLDKHEEIILKPLNQCFGSGVMYLKKGDKNTSVIINSMTNNSKKLTMVQQYIPKAIYGDKRVMFLGDKVLPYCIQKIPSNNDFKFCEHKDSNIKKATLSQEEINNFTPVAKKLNSMGISMVGLDVIDGKIIEINVTSPCYFIKEINHHFGINLENEITDFILSKALAFV